MGAGIFFIPIQISPAPGAILSQARPTFKWAAYPEATSYHLEVISLADPKNNEISADTTDTSYTAAVDLTGPYTWAVTVTDGDPYAPPINDQFSITSGVPAAPVLLQPANKAIFGPIFPPIMSWTNVAFAKNFEVQVSNSPSFSYLNPGAPLILGDPTKSTISAPIDLWPPSLPENRHYYIRVRAINSDGAAGKWSAVHWFSFDVIPPAVPTPLSPHDKGAVTNPQLSLSWSKVPDAAGYEIEFAPGDLTDVNDSAFISSTLLGQATSYKLPVSIGEGDYSWAVQAYDAAGNSSGWSPVQTFTMLAGLSVPKTPMPTPSAAPSLTPTSIEPSLTPTPVPTQPTIEPPTATPIEPTVEPSSATAQEPMATPVPTDTPEPLATPVQ
jgi:hypothetical protein